MSYSVCKTGQPRPRLHKVFFFGFNIKDVALGFKTYKFSKNQRVSSRRFWQLTEKMDGNVLRLLYGFSSSWIRGNAREKNSQPITGLQEVFTHGLLVNKQCLFSARNYVENPTSVSKVFPSSTSGRRSYVAVLNLFILPFCTRKPAVVHRISLTEDL